MLLIRKNTKDSDEQCKLTITKDIGRLCLCINKKLLKALTSKHKICNSAIERELVIRLNMHPPVIHQKHASMPFSKVHKCGQRTALIQ